MDPAQEDELNGRLARAREALGRGRPEEAEPEVAALLAAEPDHPEGLRLRAVLDLGAGRTTAAREALERAVAAGVRDGELLQALGALLNGEGRFEEAREHLARARAERSGLASFWTSYGLALQGCCDGPGSGAAFLEAVRREPGNPDLLLNLARHLLDRGRIPEAAPLLREALRLRPGDAAAASAVLMSGLYDPARTPRDLAAEHRAWGEALEASLPVAPCPVPDPDPERPLTLAFLSADFREHSCAHFLEPLLAALDRTRFRAVLVATVAQADGRTERFRALADAWIDAAPLDDAALAERLRGAGVDLLLDLGGHSAGNRLALLARRPAPVQLSWLGYPFTTGLGRLEGRVTDALVDPPGAEALASEPLLRLAAPCLCWQPPAGGPGPLEDPAPGRAFTFGSFNHFAKLNEGVVATWAAALRRVPGSRLRLKGHGGGDPEVRERLLETFAGEGVPGSRIEFAGWVEGPDGHLAAYREVDLALDPFPYNGVTTTLEALWMGVPVVALRGVHSLSRHGVMLLETLGLDGLVAASPRAYAELAAALAGDPPRLADLRRGLRARLQSSPLCDAPGFARRLEALFREEWRKACARSQSGPGAPA